ncbi:hypothetical protein SE91_05055 [Bradyrhizobium sp. DOA1]|nr:hypothetical protein SE91_05055 [Bradyrhizobium sp. DOA1]
MAAAMAMDIRVMVTATSSAITMGRRTDGTMDARSAGAVTAARPASGSRAAADPTSALMQGVA